MTLLSCFHCSPRVLDVCKSFCFALYQLQLSLKHQTAAISVSALSLALSLFPLLEFLICSGLCLSNFLESVAYIGVFK